jgi:hypothetical protein
VVLSVKVPVAENCCWAPSAIDTFAGVTAIETSVDGLTVMVAEALTDPDEIAIVVVPVLNVSASPCVPGELLIVATLRAVELQCPNWVTFWVVPSL